MTKLFKPTEDMRSHLNKIIHQFQEATYRDNKRTENIKSKTIDLLKEELYMDDITIDTKSVMSPNIVLTLQTSESFLNLKFLNHFTQFSIQVETPEEEQMAYTLLHQVNMLGAGILGVGAKAITLIAGLLETDPLECPKLEKKYEDAMYKLHVIKKRQQATLKWFLIPALLEDDDILRFLESLNSKQLKQVSDDMVVKPNVDLVMKAMII